MEYILTKYGDGKLSIPPTADNYADYLYYLHFANGYFQPSITRYGLLLRAGIPLDSLGAKFTVRAFTQSLEILDERLKKSTWLAGEEFTAADVMIVFSLTTMRLFVPYSLEGYDSILGFLKKVTEREAYKTSRGKGDPGYEAPIGAEKPQRITG